MLTYFDTATRAYFIIFTFLFGTCVGSFLNVVIYRVPRHESIVFPASHCPNCNCKIKWYDNIPIFSFLILKGKCRNCKSPISLRYPIAEALNGILWIIVLLSTDNFSDFIFGIIFTSALFAIAMIDKENMIIPNSLNIFIFALGIIRFIVNVILYHDFKENFLETILGIIIPAMLLYVLYVIISKVLGRNSLGGGDVKLTIAAGAFLGLKGTLFGIALSAYIGLFVILVAGIFKKFDLKKAFPYGPFLSIAFFVSNLWFNDIFLWYTGKFF